MSKTFRVLALSVVLLVFAATVSHFAEAKGKPGGGGGDTTGYSITELTPPAGFDSSYANTANDFGEVAGDAGADGFAHAAYWKVDSAGQLLSAVALPQLFNRASRAFAISNSGDVVGGSDVGLDNAGDSISHAVLWRLDSAGNVTNTTDLGTLGGDYIYSGANGVNDFGYVVGWSQVKVASPDEDPMPRAVLWIVDGDGKLLKVAALETADSYANDINNSGQIVGRAFDHAALWQIDVEGNVIFATDLGTLGGRNSEATAISETGDVIGYSEMADGEEHAFRYRNGVMEDLGTLGGTSSIGNGANGNGQVVGSSTYPRSQNSFDRHPFLWQNGAISDLSKAGGRSWDLSRASAIDAGGRIAGTGTLQLNGNTWKTRGYLLTPQ